MATLALPTGRATLCISVAARPGRFGITVHNAAYRAMGLDYFYRACQASDIAPIIAAVRALDIRGCSVSMPFKEDVITYLDELSPAAEDTGAVNTVVNSEGRLIGHNTDITGAQRCLEELGVAAGARISVLGSGGVARAILKAVQMGDLGTATLYARRPAAADFAARFGACVRPWDERERASGDVLINATPIGMGGQSDALPISEGALARHAAAFDVVVGDGPTPLLRCAAAHGARTIDGFRMAFHQACAQFMLYTGVAAPADVMWTAAQSLRT